MPEVKHAFLDIKNEGQNFSFAVRATSKFIIEVCAFDTLSCSDAHVDFGFFSNEKPKYVSIRADDTTLHLRDHSKPYWISLNLDPELQHLPYPNVLKKSFPEDGITISNLNLTYRGLDRVYVQSIRTPEGTMRLYKGIKLIIYSFNILLAHRIFVFDVSDQSTILFYSRNCNKTPQEVTVRSPIQQQGEYLPLIILNQISFNPRIIFSVQQFLTFTLNAITDL